jgi:hypothetical protein
MIELSPFRNSDSAGIATLWNEQPPIQGRLQTLTVALLEQYVLSKPYFDPHGLIVARDSGRVIGIIHVGFAPGSQPGELVCRDGIVAQLIIAPRADATEISTQLLSEGEAFLRIAGATEFYGGGFGEYGPFYLGLYGGSRLPGVLAGDTQVIESLRAGGYSEHRQVGIWQRELANFRPPVDRQFVALRRQFQLRPQTADPGDRWCDTCTFGWTDRTHLEVAATATESVIGRLTFWDMEPLASSWGVRALGLANSTFPTEALRGQLLAWFLAESMRQFQTHGIVLIEVQVDQNDMVLEETCRKLSFQQVDRGIQFRKTNPKSPAP